jgi:hypothetical protein
MPKLYLGEALGLIGKTMPFIWVRLGSYLLLGLGLGVYFAVIGGLSWVLGSLWAPLGWIVFLVAVGGAWGIVRWVTKYYFYLLKAAHTSVMTEFIATGSAPAGSQVDYGRKQVTDRFRDTSILFAVDQLVDGIVKAFVRRFVRMVDILPIPGIDSLGKLLERVALMSTTYVDESILSRAYREREPNVWKTAHDGVILYAQAWKPILTNAVVLSLIGYVEFILLLIVLGLPAAAIGAVFPGMGVALAIGVIILAWMIKLAVVDAFNLAATLLAYHRSTEGMTVNEEWKGRLEDVSDKFRELGKKAAEGISSRVPKAAKEAPAFTPAGAAAGAAGSAAVSSGRAPDRSSATGQGVAEAPTDDAETESGDDRHTP